jgi:glycosyltransferase involved in cell wall biosynthesis
LRRSPDAATFGAPARSQVGRPVTKLLAIVPAYNEAGAIAGTIGDIRTHAPDFDIVVVDDGSTDRTAYVANTAGVDVIRLPFNLGIGGAMQAGYQYAL